MGNDFSGSFSQFPHVYIQGKGDGCSFCFKGPPQFNAPKPIELNTVDTTLWNSFSSDLNEHVPKLNAGLRWLSILYIIIFVPLFLYLILVPVIPLFREEVLPYLKYTSLFVIGPMIIFYLVYMRIISKNQAADKAIKNACESYKTKFELKGFSVDYRTQYTGFCKPKGTTPTRVVVFPPVPGFQESQTTDDAYVSAKNNVTNNDPSYNNDLNERKESKPDLKLTTNDRHSDDDGLIDRKAWGLE